LQENSQFVGSFLRRSVSGRFLSLDTAQCTAFVVRKASKGSIKKFFGRQVDKMGLLNHGGLMDSNTSKTKIVGPWNKGFPAVYAVKKFLVPVETNDHPFYRFTQEISDERSITALFPEATLDLMNRATPQVLTRPPYELPKVLALIAETEPDLISDPRYLRLIDLVERS
jgi:hypothetical protein